MLFNLQKKLGNAVFVKETKPIPPEEDGLQWIRRCAVSFSLISRYLLDEVRSIVERPPHVLPSPSDPARISQILQVSSLEENDNPNTYIYEALYSYERIVNELENHRVSINSRDQFTRIANELEICIDTASTIITSCNARDRTWHKIDTERRTIESLSKKVEALLTLEGSSSQTTAFQSSRCPGVSVPPDAAIPEESELQQILENEMGEQPPPLSGDSISKKNLTFAAALEKSKSMMNSSRSSSSSRSRSSSSSSSGEEVPKRSMPSPPVLQRTISRLWKMSSQKGSTQMNSKSRQASSFAGDDVDTGVEETSPEKSAVSQKGGNWSMKLPKYGKSKTSKKESARVALEQKQTELESRFARHEEKLDRLTFMFEEQGNELSLEFDRLLGNRMSLIEEILAELFHYMGQYGSYANDQIAFLKKLVPDLLLCARDRRTEKGLPLRRFSWESESGRNTHRANRRCSMVNLPAHEVQVFTLNTNRGEHSTEIEDPSRQTYSRLRFGYNAQSPGKGLITPRDAHSPVAIAGLFDQSLSDSSSSSSSVSLEAPLTNRNRIQRNLSGKPPALRPVASLRMPANQPWVMGTRTPRGESGKGSNYGISKS